MGVSWAKAAWWGSPVSLRNRPALIPCCGLSLLGATWGRCSSGRNKVVEPQGQQSGHHWVVLLQQEDWGCIFGAVTEGLLYIFEGFLPFSPVCNMRQILWGTPLWSQLWVLVAHFRASAKVPFNILFQARYKLRACAKCVLRKKVNSFSYFRDVARNNKNKQTEC